MKGPRVLLENEGKWVTDIGIAVAGKRVVFRGKDLFRELRNIRWTGLLIYGVTGRFLPENELKLVEATWVISVSYPDPRIWNNRIAALAGTARSTCPLAVSAAMAATEATLYGYGAQKGAIAFLLRAQEQLDRGADLKTLVMGELRKHRRIFGYGRPQAIHGQIDERIAPLLEVAHRLELDTGPYLKLALEIDGILAKSRYGIRMTVAAVSAGLCADMGLTPEELVAGAIPAYIGGMVPCYLDALQHREGTLFPLRCSCIDYRGKSSRSWD